MTETAAQSVKKNIAISAFTVEADHPRNSDLLVQSVPGVRLRSAIRGSKPATNFLRGGGKTVPVDQATAMADLPDLPGMRLTINPSKLTVEVSDGLTDEQCTEIAKHLRNRGIYSSTVKVNPVPTREEVIDEDHMKTLCREVFNLLELGHMTLIKGAEFDMSKVEKLPGEFLLNPGSRIQSSQPRYEKDYNNWIQKLSANG